MGVPLLDLTRQYAPLADDVGGAIQRLCATQRFILGDEVEAFESECQAALGADHTVAVSSGTDALLVALMALDVGPGDEVIVPAFTFFATAGVVWRLGARPVFVDVREDDFGIDPEGVAAAVTEKTRAIVPVHLYGQACDLDGVMRAAPGIPVVEDCAQSWGSEHRGRTTGTLGDVGAFSFFPSKNLGGFGDGGLVTVADPDTARRLRELRVHGQSGVYEHATVGGNFRLDALQAAVLRVKLPHVPGWIEGRRSNAARYAELFADAGLSGTVRLPEALDGRGHTFNQYVVRVPRRDELRAHLAERGIGHAVYYPLPLHLQPCFSSLGGREGQLPVSERSSREVLALPVFPELTAREQQEVVGAISEFYGG